MFVKMISNIPKWVQNLHNYSWNGIIVAYEYTHLNSTSFEWLYGPVKEIHTNLINPSANSNKHGHTKITYIHDDIELSKNVPLHDASTNNSDRNRHVRVDHENKISYDRNIPLSEFSSNTFAEKGHSDHGTREYKLADKIQPGGYSIPGQLPQKSHNQQYVINDSGKSNTSRLINAEMNGRFQ